MENKDHSPKDRYVCRFCGGEWFLNWEDSVFEWEDMETVFYCPHCGKVSFP